jgi:hypothetical protein
LEGEDMNKKSILRMAIGMAACCLIPALIVLAISIFGIASDNRIISSIVTFLCPIMMVGMMLFMGMGGKNGHNHKGHSGHSCCHGEDPKDSESLN